MNTQQFTVSLFAASTLFGSLPALAQSPSPDQRPVPNYPSESEADKVRNIEVSSDQLRQRPRSASELDNLGRSIQVDRAQSADNSQPAAIFTNSDDQPSKFKVPVQQF